MKLLKWLTAILTGLVLLFFSGPKPEKLHLTTTIPSIKTDINFHEAEIKQREEKQAYLKPDNNSRIIWADSINKNKTPISIVYLHGFSASPEEGNPVCTDFAKRYGCNLYIPRLYKHGLNEPEPLLDFTAEGLLNSAKDAVAIGKLLGEKVILMSTSTGGTLSLYITSGNPDIDGLILYSPNIDLYDSRSFILTQPWGLEIAKIINESPYYKFEGPAGAEKFWTMSYRIEALIQLKLLLQKTMTEETFQKIKIPVFLAYYPDDDVVSVPEMMKMFQQVGTSPEKKVKISLPLTGTHAIASGLWSKDIEGVKKETFRFAEVTLGMKPIK